VAVLALFGALWGFLYGAIMNIWFWPYAVGPSQMYWSAGIGLAETLQRYAVFYAVTSLVWDVAAAVGNALLIAILGAAILRILRRFHSRFEFAYAPDAQPAISAPLRTPATAGGD
jgi:energy-coupling factor transport system substrate-specific component